MEGSFLVRRIGSVKRKYFEDHFDEVYDEFHEKSFKINKDAELVMKREGKLMVFFARLEDSDKYDQTDFVYSDLEYLSMIIEEDLLKTNKKNPNKHDIK